MQLIDEAVSHYDRVTKAWRYLLGEDFHCGRFINGNESLESATENLTTLMALKGSMDAEMTILDVGCGIGNPACSLAEQYGCRVTGISTSVTGIEHATQRAKERGCSDRVSFMVADGMNNGIAN